jgi:hypothetical protein
MLSNQTIEKLQAMRLEGMVAALEACALGHQACRDGFRTQYFHARKLFRSLEAAHADGSLARLLKSLGGCPNIFRNTCPISPKSAHVGRILEMMKRRPRSLLREQASLHSELPWWTQKNDHSRRPSLSITCSEI